MSKAGRTKERKEAGDKAKSWGIVVAFVAIVIAVVVAIVVSIAALGLGCALKLVC